MNNFIITYRIKSDETYQARYDSFIRKVKEAGGQAFWNETSSFYALRACITAEALCTVLCRETGFDCCRDAVVVIDTKSRSLATSGAIHDLELLSECLGLPTCSC